MAAKPAGIDNRGNYVTVTLCIFRGVTNRGGWADGVAAGAAGKGRKTASPKISYWLTNTRNNERAKSSPSQQTFAMLAVNLFALYSHAAQHFTFKLRAPPPAPKK